MLNSLMVYQVRINYITSETDIKRNYFNYLRLSPSFVLNNVVYKKLGILMDIKEKNHIITITPLINLKVVVRSSVLGQRQTDSNV